LQKIVLFGKNFCLAKGPKFTEKNGKRMEKNRKERKRKGKKGKGQQNKKYSGRRNG